jgi:TolA-binding protein
MRTKMRTKRMNPPAKGSLGSELTMGFIFSFTAIALLSSSVRAEGPREEAKDRIIDEASADTQNEAEQELAAMAKKYAGTAREATLLLRLSELRIEIASTVFRVEYGSDLAKRNAQSRDGRKKIQHEGVVLRAVGSLGRILSLYPKSEEAGRALFLRGKAYRELRQNRNALADFESFLGRYPNRTERGLAVIGVADISIENKDYSRAIGVLSALTQNSSHLFYALALQKRAWSFYASGSPLIAVAELGKLAQFFGRKESKGLLTDGERAVRESALSDVSATAYSAYFLSPNRFSLPQANRLLRMFDSGDGYREMAAQFADHLRAADSAVALGEWKGLVLQSDPSRKENLPLLVSVFNYELEREAYSEAAKVAQEIAGVIEKDRTSATAQEAMTLVVKAADRLTKRIVDYRGSEKSTQSEATLIRLLPTIDQMLGVEDLRRFGIRWNLAETFYTLGRFESSALFYRFIYTQWNASQTKAAEILNRQQKGVKISQFDAGLKSVASRFEILRQSGFGTKELVVSAAPDSVNPLKPFTAAQAKGLREWTSWVDELALRDEIQRDAEARKAISHFQFEAIRGLYLIGQRSVALKRSTEFVMGNETAFSVPAATLVLDTYIARQDWEKVETTARDFSRLAFLKKTAFGTKLAEQAAAARFKRADLAFRGKSFAASAEQANEFLKNYSQHPLAVDAKGIACNSNFQRGELSDALDCFQELAEDFPRTEAARQALHTSARIEDDRYSFLKAARLYDRYLSLGKGAGKSRSKDAGALSTKEIAAIRLRIVRLTRASGDAEQMAQVSRRKDLCGESRETKKECEVTSAVSVLLKGKDADKERAVRLITSAPNELKAVWATFAIENWAVYSQKNLDRILNTLITHWKDADVSVRYLLIPRLVKIIPEELARERMILKRDQLRAKAPEILRRIKTLQSWETRTSMVAKLPLNRLRASSYEQTARGYEDLIEELRNIPAPNDGGAGAKAEQDALIAKMVEPFRLKANELNANAIRLSRSSLGSGNADQFDGIWSSSESKAGRYSLAAATLREAWPKAIEDENWSRVGFFSDEASQLTSLSPEWVKAARALSLARSGAEAEARVLFADACRGPSAEKSLKAACRASALSGKERG